MERATAETVLCPEPKCHAEVGVTCRNFWSGEPLENQTAHEKRIKAVNEEGKEKRPTNAPRRTDGQRSPAS